VGGFFISPSQSTIMNHPAIEVVMAFEDGQDCAVAHPETMDEARCEAATMHALGHFPFLRVNGQVVGRWNGQYFQGSPATLH
jgi:hypothetical protein